MKKVFCFLGIVSIIAVLFSGVFEVKNQCIRIHVRANSNNAIDQSVKYEVKDTIVNYLTPYVSGATTFDEAKTIVSAKLQDIEHVANEVLINNGFYYGVRANLTREQFPARSYDGYTLAEGVYDALIVELGEGVGDNWWCVLFPPLCFSPKGSADTIEYRSKLAELCQSIFG